MWDLQALTYSGFSFWIICINVTLACSWFGLLLARHDNASNHQVQYHMFTGLKFKCRPIISWSRHKDIIKEVFYYNMKKKFKVTKHASIVLGTGITLPKSIIVVQNCMQVLYHAHHDNLVAKKYPNWPKVHSLAMTNISTILMKKFNLSV